MYAVILQGTFLSYIFKIFPWVLLFSMCFFAKGLMGNYFVKMRHVGVYIPDRMLF